jgi:general secretion pathway protein D
MKRLCIQLFFWAVIAATVYAVEKPPREYISPDQIVTLTSDLSIREAIAILSNTALSTTGKAIVDPEGRDNPIGIDIYHRHWRDALELLLAHNHLWYIEGTESFLIFKPRLGPDGKPLFIPPGAEDPTRITASTREVKIEAVFFEGDRKTLREIGINWSSLIDGRLTVGGEITGADQLSSSILSLSASGSGTSGNTEVKVEALMQAMESLDKGHIIARPEVTVADRKTGRIQVGQDFSVRSRDYAGNTIEEFFSVGTILEVIPTIVFGGQRAYIHLHIHAERSTVSPDAVTTTVNKTETDTDVLLYDGEQTAIGGLYVTKNNLTRRGMPFLKDLPWWVLGFRYLFGYNSDEKEISELVILMRAHLMPEASSRFSRRTELEEERQESFQRVRERFK